jgi:hypothetical protein
MARDNGERLLAPTATPTRKSTLGSWLGSTFRFHSPEHERDWQQRAYRQSVDPDRWQQQPPVDHQTQSLFDGMPDLADGRYFFGPDGKYRLMTMDLREDRDIADIRRKAFNEFVQSGVTWDALAQYPDDKPHPGEAEALAARETKRATADTAAKATDAGRVGDRFGPETAKPDLTRIAPDIAPDLAGQSADWGLPTKEPGPAPVLVATSDKTISGLPKEVERSQPFVTPSSRTPAQRRNFNEKLVGRTANDNHRIAANDNVLTAAGQNIQGRVEGQASERLIGAPTATAGEAPDADADWQVTNRLFNWQRDGKSAPAPTEYAINVASDEGRFVYLEEMKDEWSRLLEQDPEKVFRSMASEAEKLSNAAQKDFHEAYRRTATPEEVAEIDDAVAKIVFAPAEHWTKAGDKPNEQVVEPKPFLGVIEPVELAGSELASAFYQAAKVVAEGKVEKFGGRPGSKETRQIIARVVEKLAKAIEACGGSVKSRFYGTNEKFLRSGQAKGGSFADKFLKFEYNGKTIGFFGNHAATYADGVTLRPNEANQIQKIVGNIARGLEHGDLEIDAAGVGYFSKRKRGQSMKDYLRTVNDFARKMVDCKRPFLIKIRIEKPTIEFPQNDN